MCLTLSNILDVLKTSYLHTNNVKLSHHVITVCVHPVTVTEMTKSLYIVQ